MSFLKKIGRWFLDIDNQFDTTFKNIGDISKKLDDVKIAVESNNQRVANIESGISNGIQNELGSLKGEISTRFGTVDSGLKALQEKVDKLTDEQAAEIAKLRAEIAEVEKALNAKIAEVKNLQAIVADKDKQIEEHLADLENFKQQSSEAENKLQNVTSQLTEAQEVLAAERKKSAAAEKALQSWRDAVAYYAQVRNAMRKCDTFKKFLEDRNLTDDSEIGLLAFVQELGKTMVFLEKIHDTARDAKMLTKELMSDEELAVYKALNECYRHIWNINFDVFCTPGKFNERKPVGENFNKIAFNKDEAIYLNDKTNKNMKNITGIYVPLLLNRENNVSKNAYVEANNL